MGGRSTPAAATAIVLISATGPAIVISPIVGATGGSRVLRFSTRGGLIALNELRGDRLFQDFFNVLEQLALFGTDQ